MSLTRLVMMRLPLILNLPCHSEVVKMANTNVNVSFTLTPYKLNDCNFKLSDDRAAKSLNSFGVFDYMLTASESSKVEDKIIKSSKLKLKESVAISEQNSKSIVVNKKESLSVVVTYWDNIKFILRFVETFACTDKLSNNYILNKAENATITDYINKEIGVNLSENLNIVDDFIRKIKFIRLFLEKLKTADKETNSIVKNNIECFGIVERLFNSMEILKKESLETTDSIKHEASFKRLFYENIGVIEGIVKNISINKKERFSIEDVLIRACNAVLSNIGMSVDGMTLDKFKDLILTPPSYDKFVDFNVGDYEYQKAMVRLLVESASAQAEPLIYDMGIHVDIDDTNDRGSTQIVNKASATKVYFNKFYYHAPEVNVTLKGGNVADGLIIPSIVSIGNIDENGRYFEVELLNSENKRVTGFITWTSKGY